LSGPLEDLHILLLEDEALIALDVEQLCLDAGAAGVTIVRKVEGLGDLQLDRFDAAIVDLMLAGKPTMAFASRLVEARIPFIFATGQVGRIGGLAPFADIPVVGKPYFGSAIADGLTEAIRRMSVVSDDRD
jgi:DNA-binding response OmpR family regulator